MQLVAQGCGCENLEQFRLWARKLFGPKWAYRLRGCIQKIGEALANGAEPARFRHVVRGIADLERVPAHLRTEAARVLAVMG